MGSRARIYAAMRRRRGGRRAEGQGLVEYALILSLVAVLVMVALRFLQPNISTALDAVASAMHPAGGTAPVAAATISLGGAGCVPSPANVTITLNGTVNWQQGAGCSYAFVTAYRPDSSIWASQAAPATFSFFFAGTYTYTLDTGSGPVAGGQIVVQ